MTLYLEIYCEEIILSPGHELELLIEETLDTIQPNLIYCDGGIQVYHPLDTDNWMIKFRGQLIRPGYPTILKNYEP